jgi:glutamate synthase domain-containing protein 2
MRPVEVARWSELADRVPAAALVESVDLVIVRWDDTHSVLYGRCLHRGALLADGHIRNDDLVCGVHNWDYRYDTGISSYDNSERLHKFNSWVEGDALMVDADEVAAWEATNPQPYDRSAYQGTYQDHYDDHVERHVRLIHRLAAEGVDAYGPHGPITSMGVPHDRLPSWDDIQILTAQLARKPLADDAPVGTDVAIGPNAAKPLHLEIPLFVSDMSFGALSREAKIALARGAEMAGTGIASGEGGMLPEEQAENTRYFYEYASGRFGFSWDKVGLAQAFHLKFGQAAKTGTGGHLPGHKVTFEIARVRGLAPGQDAISPAMFEDFRTLRDIREFAVEVRERTGGVPVGVKMSAQHIEADLEAALEVGADYVILDGRGGGTGAAPRMFRDHISVPTIPALARARRFLDFAERQDVTLVITGGLRTHVDFFKAMALGADAVAVANSAMQAIGCLGMRACSTNNCPVGIATQREDLRARLPVDEAAHRLHRFFNATVELMKVLARATGRSHLCQLERDDLTTFDYEMHRLTGITYGGAGGG